MPRKLIKKWMPHQGHITQNSMLKKLGPRLQDPSIWHINRRSVSGAFAVGLFCGFLPIPFQMVIAAIAAIIFRVNILISVPLVWFSNPFTIPPIFYFCYQVGSWILEIPPQHFEFELSFDWLMAELGAIWEPLLLGSLLIGSISAIIGFFAVRIFWRFHIWQHIKQRRERKLRSKASSN